MASPADATVQRPSTDENAAAGGAADDELEVVVRTPLRLQLLRIAVFLALGATLGALSGEAYVIAANREHATFVGEFQGAVAEMEQVVTAGFGAKVEAAVAMATLSAAAGAVAPGGGLPNASVPGFYAFAAPIVAVSGARAVSWNPVVTAQSLAGWNAFAAANAATAAGAFAALPASTPMVNINTLGLWQKNASGSKVPVTPRAFYTPVWQIAPMNNSDANQNAINYDLYSEPTRHAALSTLLATGSPAVTDLLQLVQDGPLVNGQITRASGIVFAAATAVPGSALANAPQAAGAAAAGLPPGLLGIVSVVFSWDEVFTAAVPSFISGIDLFLINTANPNSNFTLQAVGGRVLNVGPGFRHAPTELDKYAETFPVSSGNIQWAVSVYPTPALLRSYQTTSPRDQAIGVALLIFGCIAILGSYEAISNGRLARLATAARSTKALVDQFFPKSFQGRVLEAHASASRVPKRSTSSANPFGGGGAGDDAGAKERMLSRFRRFMGRKGGSEGEEGDEDPRSSQSEGIIADRFNHVTIMFADVVGFTAWAGQQQPERVFAARRRRRSSRRTHRTPAPDARPAAGAKQVLEKLYGEFDALCRKWGVFKVETVGDEYMACCGLPEESEQHAVHMAGCALEMLAAVARVGAETGHTGLQVRVGLHSGGVVAGVLRGDKPRFQLFGDTVNTASRMESTGQPGQIQVSDATAALLRASTASFRLRYRGRVAAKGKGEVDTWWLSGQVASFTAPAAGDLNSSLHGGTAAAAALSDVVVAAPAAEP